MNYFFRSSGVDKFKIQIILIVIGSLVFFYYRPYDGLAAFNGGLISLVNAYLIARHIKVQKNTPGAGATRSFRMLLKSVAIRMGVVVFLIFTGIRLVKMPALALVVGFVIGQIGFLLDRGFSKRV